MRKEKVFLHEPLKAEEKETHLNLLASDRETWIVYTDDEKMIALFDLIAADKTAKGFGYEYRLDASKIVFEKPKKKIKVEKPQKASKTRSSFGSFFFNSQSWNASDDERELMLKTKTKRDVGTNIGPIQNLKQLREAIEPYGDKKLDQEIHRLTLNVYRKFIEQRDAQRKTKRNKDFDSRKKED